MNLALLKAISNLLNDLPNSSEENGQVKRRVTLSDTYSADANIAPASYKIDDGVLVIGDSNWCARVVDPGAPKPVYDFLDRCPGGYINEDWQVGDILVWGGKDKKGRKEGPFDRLVYRVQEDGIDCLKVDYVTARRLRKILIANRDGGQSPTSSPEA